MKKEVMLYNGYEFEQINTSRLKGIELDNVNYVERAGNRIVVHYKSGKLSLYIKSNNIYEFVKILKDEN